MIVVWIVVGLAALWLLGLGVTALGLWAFARTMEKNHEHREDWDE